jgi:hypothetical protein
MRTTTQLAVDVTYRAIEDDCRLVTRAGDDFLLEGRAHNLQRDAEPGVGWLDALSEAVQECIPSGWNTLLAHASETIKHAGLETFMNGAMHAAMHAHLLPCRTPGAWRAERR